jgi:hypothetical protein
MEQGADAKAEGKTAARRVFPALLLIALFGIAAISSAAQQQASTNWDAESPESTPRSPRTIAPPVPPKAIHIGSLTLAGSLRGRAENWSWFEVPAAQVDYTFGALLFRLSLSQKKDRFEWLVEGMSPWLIHLPTNAVLPAPQGQLGLGGSYFAANLQQDGSAVFRQGYVRFEGLFGDAASGLLLGRFEFSDGAEVKPADASLALLKRDRIAQRLIGPFGFTHVGRGFDGVQYVRAGKINNFTFVAARPTEGVFQLRSLYELDVDFYYGAFTRQLPGKTSQGEARLFALHYHDGRNVLKTDNRPQAVRTADHRNIRLTTIGGHAMDVFGKNGGKVDLLVWGAAQFGRWGLLDHRAAAIAVEGGYQFAVPWKPWVRAGYFRGTGDGNPGDDTHSTFFQMLPTPRIYARFPFFDLMNNEDIFAQILLKPRSKLSLRGDVHYLRLSNPRDLWYVGGGPFQQESFGYVGRPNNGHSVLGTLADLSVDYALTSTTNLTFYVGGVRGGRVPGSIYPAGGAHPGARMLYFEFVQSF